MNIDVVTMLDTSECWDNVTETWVKLSLDTDNSLHSFLIKLLRLLLNMNMEEKRGGGGHH